ncbi:hypothetical protein [Burkholderia sp. 9120]|uniref:hypothetical protein n=1 Tax=Burkholderia sp. 9120 TaxID=1500897 RepID=UPI0006894D4C|nr:hypothetical protein [Burkholderia sp. 9120]
MALNSNFQDRLLGRAPIDESALIAGLDALVPGERQRKEAVFHAAHPAIERALARKVPQKRILEALNRGGLKLSLGGFKALLTEERDALAKNGNYVTCAHCGAVLPAVT